MMNEIEERIQKLKKGCGRGLFRREGGITYCGEIYITKNPYGGKETLRLCTDCKARIAELEFANKIIKEKMQKELEKKNANM